MPSLSQEQENLRSRAWSCPQSCPICLEDFTTRPRGAADGSSKDKAKRTEDDEASSSAAGAAGGLDEEAGPSTSLLHSGSANSDEEFARMSAAGQAAVRRLRQRRRAGGSSGGAGASGSGSGGWAEGAGPSTAAASGTGEDGGRQRLPVTLGCGHTFCEACIEQWWVGGMFWRACVAGPCVAGCAFWLFLQPALPSSTTALQWLPLGNPQSQLPHPTCHPPASPTAGWRRA